MLWTNLTDDEKAGKFLDYIKKIGGVAGNLIIIDPYIFCRTSSDSYQRLLEKILKDSNYASLKIITDKAHFDKDFFEKIKLAVNKAIEILFSDEFHDRFWIANGNKGFISGASLNGVGKKYSLINMLEDKDVADIMDIIDKM